MCPQPRPLPPPPDPRPGACLVHDQDAAVGLKRVCVNLQNGAHAGGGQRGGMVVSEAGCGASAGERATCDGAHAGGVLPRLRRPPPNAQATHARARSGSPGHAPAGAVSVAHPKLAGPRKRALLLRRGRGAREGATGMERHPSLGAPARHGAHARSHTVHAPPHACPCNHECVRTCTSPSSMSGSPSIRVLNRTRYLGGGRGEEGRGWCGGVQRRRVGVSRWYLLGAPRDERRAPCLAQDSSGPA